MQSLHKICTVTKILLACHAFSFTAMSTHCVKLPTRFMSIKPIGCILYMVRCFFCGMTPTVKKFKVTLLSNLDTRDENLCSTSSVHFRTIRHVGHRPRAEDGGESLPYLALWDASSDNQHQTTATITIIPMKGMERTGCSDGWMKL